MILKVLFVVIIASTDLVSSPVFAEQAEEDILNMSVKSLVSLTIKSDSVMRTQLML